jgi:putative transcriptional regulator
LRKRSKRKQKFTFHVSREALATVVAGILLALIPIIVAHGGYRGEILAANEHVGAPFDKSLILIDRYGIEGATGIILNKPLPENQRAKLTAFIRDAGIPIGYGGPMGLFDHIIVLEEEKPGGPGSSMQFKLSDWDDAVRAAPDLLDKIRQSIKNGDQRYRIFTGTISWSPLQLESEILVRGEWNVLPSSHDLVFQNGAASQWDALPRQEKAKNKAKADQS